MTKELPLAHIRNIGVIAHIDAGKTTTTERMLYYSGRTHRMGTVDAGTTVTDWMDQERERGITITAAAITTTWRSGIDGEEAQINIIDTPGHIDFTAEVQRSLRVLDGGVVIFDGVSGVEPQSETVWRQADEYGVPRICFVNKLDRVGADFEATLLSMVQRLGAHPLALQMPIGIEDQFQGVVDLIEMKALIFSDELGAHPEVEAIPPHLLEQAVAAREELVETIAETDDDLATKYLEGEEISTAELYQALRRAVIANQLVPVLAGSALRNKGVQPLLDAIVRYLPSPADIPPIAGIDPRTGETITRDHSSDSPFSALVFKIVSDPFAGRLVYARVYSGLLKAGETVYNANRKHSERVGRLLQMQAVKRNEIEEVRAGDIAAIIGLKDTFTGETLCDAKAEILLESIDFPEPVIRIAIEARTTADQDKLGSALARLAEEDPTFKTGQDPQSGQTLISGMGELHLEVLVERLRREFGVQCKVGLPQVAYRETITGSGEAEGRYIRQSGGHGHYAVVQLRIDPNKLGEGFIFESQIKGGALPQEFVRAAERGVAGAMEAGILASYPVVDIKVTLLDGKYHEVDSSAADYEIASSQAFKEAVRRAGPILLEPMMAVETTTAEEYVGSVINDCARRHGNVNELLARSDRTNVVRATVPLSEMIGYATDLRSLTSGLGAFTMQLQNYAPAGDETHARVLGPEWRTFVGSR